MKTNMIKLILPLKGLTSTEKIILVDAIINEEKEFVGKTCYTRLQMGRMRYNKQMRGLRDKGLVREVKRGTYTLNVDIF